MIRGEHVVLRPARMSDRPAIFEWLAKSDVTAEMLGPPKFPETPAPTWEEFIEDYTEDYFEGSGWEHGQSFIIEVGGEGRGQVNFDRRHLPEGTAELDIWMRSRADCGQGWGSDALQTLATWLNARFGLSRFLIRPSARNERAIRAYERAGFERVEMNDEEQTRCYGEGDYPDTVVLIRRIGD